MRNKIWVLELALSTCVLSTATFPTPRPDQTAQLVQAAEDVLGKVIKETPLRRCSLLFVLDDASIIRLNRIIGSDLQETDQVAIIKVTSNKGDDANLTHASFPEVVAQARRLRVLSWCMTMVVISSNPAFLIAFAEASDTGRLLMWETRLLVVTRLDMSIVQSLLEDYWTFSMMNTMFLTSKPEPKNERCQLYMHLPFTAGGAKVVRVASWSKTHGLVRVDGHTYFPEKYNNFHGMTINATWFPFPPYLMEVAHTDANPSQVTAYAGRDYSILQAIAEALNFTVNFLSYQGWDQVMIRLIHREAYIRPIKLAVLPNLLEIYDFTFFIERATLGFSMAKPTIKPSWQSLYYPLEPEVWGSIAAAVILVFIVLMLIRPESEKKTHETWPVLKQVVGTLLDEAIPGGLPRSSPTRVVLTAWLIFSFIVGTLYRSNLTAYLTAPKYPPRVETLDDLVGKDAKITTTPDITEFIDSWKRSNSKLFKALSDRIEIVPTFTAGLLEAIEKGKAYVYERLNLEVLIAEHFTSKGGFTPLYVARQNIVPGYCGWPLSPNTPFKANLDHCILAFHGAGLIEKWTKEVLERTQFDSRRKMSTATEADGTSSGDQDAVEIHQVTTKALTLIHMQGPLFLFLVGAFLSFAVFIGEKSVSLCRHSHISSDSRDQATASLHHYEGSADGVSAPAQLF